MRMGMTCVTLTLDLAMTSAQAVGGKEARGKERVRHPHIRSTPEATDAVYRAIYLEAESSERWLWTTGAGSVEVSLTAGNGKAIFRTIVFSCCTLHACMAQ